LDRLLTNNSVEDMFYRHSEPSLRSN
jgi:hypothetical protein